MTPPDLGSTSDGTPLVLHVIPTPLARGAQREARALADELDLPGVRTHRVLTLFDGTPEVRADFSLRYPPGDSPAEGFDPRLVVKLRRVLREFDPALVVAHGGDPLKYLVPAMIGRRRPLAYYAIGTFAGSTESTLGVGMWRQLLKRVDAVAAEGDEVKVQLSELLGVPPAKVVMTPNGRDPEIYHPRPEGIGSGETPPVVTFVGALTDGKRPERFIEVIAGLRAAGVALRAVLVGGGARMEEITAPAAAADVELLGSRSDIAELLRHSDLMIFPSKPQGEGMPGVLIEAGLSGLPVVATDVPGVRTVIDDGTTGLIHDVDDLDGMILSTRRLIEDGDARHAMGSAARQRCLEQFSIEAVGATWLRLLAPLLPAGATPDLRPA